MTKVDAVHSTGRRGRWWERLLAKCFPFLLKKCPFGSKHWRWSRICTCAFNLRSEDLKKASWHGGIYDLRHGIELQPCAACNPDFSPENHQWDLTDEEEWIIFSWRLYRAEKIDLHEPSPSAYSIEVVMDGESEVLFNRRSTKKELPGAVVYPVRGPSDVN